MQYLNILFATSELHPLIKTGGLADVSGSLPIALQSLGHQVTVMLPGYRSALAKLNKAETLATFSVDEYEFSLLDTHIPDTHVRCLLVCCDALFDRPGNPYTYDGNHEWPDNALRFGLFCKAIIHTINHVADLLCGYPDVVHCNDWQTGLVPALLSLQPIRPATVFTIHNLAYQGLFDDGWVKKLRLHGQFWHYQSLEFHNHLSFIKGGLVYADRINTVSPTYADEIQTSEFGEGLDGLLRYRANALSGILNGIDTKQWDPATDPFLYCHFDRTDLAGKQRSKSHLQRILGLPVCDKPILANIGRHAQQKGIDLILKIMPQLIEKQVQLIFLGSGDPRIENALGNWMQLHPDRVHVVTGYNEALAHKIEAGADMFVMPSRYEPCGLNQMYSLHYGTVPIVRKTGGLADTVVRADETSLADKTANGFSFEDDDASALLNTIEQALTTYSDATTWRMLQHNGMSTDFSWERSAQQYIELYLQAAQTRAQ